MDASKSSIFYVKILLVGTEKTTKLFKIIYCEEFWTFPIFTSRFCSTSQKKNGESLKKKCTSSGGQFFELHAKIETSSVVPWKKKERQLERKGKRLLLQTMLFRIIITTVDYYSPILLLNNQFFVLEGWCNIIHQFLKSSFNIIL